MKQKFMDLFPKIEVQQKWGFVACVIVMVITHLYMFTNKIINHDDVNRLFVGDTDEMKIQHGRWAGVIFDRVSGSSVSIPYVMGMISVLSMAGTAVILISLFRIEKKISIVLLVGLLCTFPVSANIFLYGYIADVYYISMFLSTWGVWLLVQGKRDDNFAGIILLALSCGCYQAFWCLGMAFLFLVCFVDCIDSEGEWKIIRNRIAVRFICAATSLGLYLIINKCFQIVTGYGSTSYEGLDRMGQFDGMWSFVQVFVYAYYEFVRFFYLKGSFVESRLLIVVNIVLTVLACGMIIRKVKQAKCSAWYWFTMIIICGFIPLAANLVSLVSKNRTHILMQYGFIMPYILCVVLTEQQRKGKGAVRLLSYVLLGIVVYHGYLTDNEIYFKQQLNYEATYSYTTRMLSRMEDTEGYDPSVPVAFINGNSPNSGRTQILIENYPEDMSYFNRLDDMVGVEPRTFVKKADDIADFCKYYHGYDLQVADPEVIQELAGTEIFKNMPAYPQKGSIRYIDGTLVIKLADVK